MILWMLQCIEWSQGSLKLKHTMVKGRQFMGTENPLVQPEVDPLVQATPQDTAYIHGVDYHKLEKLSKLVKELNDESKLSLKS